MKKYIVVFLFLALFFILPRKSFAEWIKHPQNPLIKATANTWYSIHATGPNVIFDEGIFKMWFQGHDGSTSKIGYASSSDGINWNIQTQPQITVSSPGLANGLEVVEPMVIKNGTVYQMWFKEYIPGENQIRYAISIDGNTWTINPQPVFTKSQEPWEYTGPTNPAVIFENNEYKMWYTAAGSATPWKLGYATSSDGITWTRYGNNPLNIPTLGFVGGPTVIKINNQYHMWYHTGSGMNTDIYHVISNDGIQWTCEGNCSVLHIENGTFDSQGMVAPTVIQQNGKLYLWYGGSNGPNWQIGLATFELPVTPTPTPTPYSLHPIVIIPGFMTSWNKEAILHNRPVTQSDWKLAPFIKEYDGILKTLKNIGYKENEDLFLFNFDWRKNIDFIADDLQSYLQNNILNKMQGEKINIVGHSLGGLVGRIWTQKYNQNRLNTLVTVGSPHKGTAQVYKPLEGGEIDRSNNFLWLAEKTIFILNKDSFESDRDTINSVFPIARDIFPTYDFLKKQDNSFISVNSMDIKNDLLNTYNQSQQIIYPVLHSFTGKSGATLFGFTISNRTLLDQLLNLYPDGRPTTGINDVGDFVVLSSSSSMGNNIHTLNNDHSEIIYTKNAIKEILNSLGVPYQDNQVAEGQGIIISPSLIFFLKSPAEMEVAFNGNVYPEQEGVIFIPNAETGSYQLNVKGKESGKYTVIVGQVGEQNDEWNTIEGKINENNPTSQIDTYTINFNPQKPSFPLPPSESLFNELIQYLQNLGDSTFNKTIISLQKSKEYFIKKNMVKLQNELLIAHKQLFHIFHKSKSAVSRKQLLITIEKLEYIYQETLTNYKSPPVWKLKLELLTYGKRFEALQRKLLSKKQKILANTISLPLQTIDRKFKSARENLSDNKKYSEILLHSIRELLEGLQSL